MKTLNSTLSSFLVESPISGFKMIHHPYLVEVMFGGSDAEIVRANTFFEYKQKSINQALKDKDFAKATFLCERPYRLEFFLTHVESNTPEYCSLLAEIYVDSEGISKNLEIWLDLFADCEDKKLLMDEDDFNFYESLDDEFMVYRGVESCHSKGGSISWTLNIKTAEWFANRFKKSGVVLSGLVRKQDIFATFLGRGEFEVVVDSANIDLKI